jgi:hypothetical protein
MVVVKISRILSLCRLKFIPSNFPQVVRDVKRENYLRDALGRIKQIDKGQEAKLLISCALALLKNLGDPRSPGAGTTGTLPPENIEGE